MLREPTRAGSAPSATPVLSLGTGTPPTWLDHAHKTLDAATFAAYGWPADLSCDAILTRLLALNLERAGSPAVEAEPD